MMLSFQNYQRQILLYFQALLHLSAAAVDCYCLNFEQAIRTVSEDCLLAACLLSIDHKFPSFFKHLMESDETMSIKVTGWMISILLSPC